LYLEGFAGLEYSIPGETLTIRPAMPKSWEWMEVRLPIDGEWTKVQYTQDAVKVSGSPFKVLQPLAK
jgi:trehalose/maltose hydrolase-like predicted phosphorylase